MKRPLSFVLFGALLVIAAAFVLVSSQSLPPRVASHFAGDGHANGFSPRTAYVSLMLAVSVGLPLLIATLHSVILFSPALLAQVPNYDHWFAPERREATYAFLRRHGLCFPAMLAVFLCYMHWQVVRANALQPPQLSSASVVPAIVLFMLGMALWVGVLVRRFMRRT